MVICITSYLVQIFCGFVCRASLCNEPLGFLGVSTNSANLSNIGAQSSAVVDVVQIRSPDLYILIHYDRVVEISRADQLDAHVLQPVVVAVVTGRRVVVVTRQLLQLLTLSLRDFHPVL